MSISLNTITKQNSRDSDVSQTDISRDSDDLSLRKSERYTFRLSTPDVRDSEDMRQVDASKEIIITGLRDNLMMVVATREKIAEDILDIREDEEWNKEQRAYSKDGEYFYKSNIAKQTDLEIFDDEKRIEEYVLAKTLEAVHVRLSCTRMKADMIVLQENTILEAFDESNYLISRAACKWQQGKYVRALATRLKANVRERLGYKKYARLVQSQVGDPRVDLADNSYQAWAGRVASDRLVAAELKKIYSTAKGTRDSVKIIKARWNYLRAEAILSADQTALRALKSSA